MNKDIKKLYNLNKSSPVPMYFQIKQEIIKLINNKTYVTGDQLPTELEFCEALDISRPTIRQAFQELISEGYITRRKAKGTFVSKPKVDGFFFKSLQSYNEEMRSLGLTPSTKVINAKVEKVEPWFVKSIENVQGDERDIMLISWAYAQNSYPQSLIFLQKPNLFNAIEIGL